MSRDVPRDGVARAAAAAGASQEVERLAENARRCSSGRSASCTTPRTSCARRSRSRAAISRCSASSVDHPAGDRCRARRAASDRADPRAAAAARKASTSPTSSCLRRVDIEPFLEDVFLRWSEVAPRAWRLGALAPGRAARRRRGAADRARRAARERRQVHRAGRRRSSSRRRAEGASSSSTCATRASGIPQTRSTGSSSASRRADPARIRSTGGVGLGLAIVDAIAKAHGGKCSLRTSPQGSTFSLTLPGFTPRAPEAIRLAPMEPEPSPVGAESA